MKLLYAFVFIICCCFSLSLKAQSAIEMQADLGGNENDYNAVILPTDDGGFIVAGTTNSGDTGSFIVTAISPDIVTSEYWIFLVKYAPDYTVQWQKSFGGDDGNLKNGSELSDFIRTSDGGWMIAGSSSTQPYFGNKTAPSYGKTDGWAIKLDPNFNIKWQNAYGGTGNDKLNKAVELADGSFLFGGQSDSPISGTKTDTCRGFEDYWVVKIDSTGNQLWDKTLGSSQTDELEDLVVASNGDITLCGTTSSVSATDIHSGERTMTYGLSDFWVVSLDPKGTFLWDKTLGGAGQESLSKGGIYTDGTNYYVGGSSPKESIFPPTARTAVIKGMTDAWLVKLDSNGTTLWDKSYGGSPSSVQSISCLINIPGSSDLFVTANSDSDSYGDKSEDSRGDNDFWLLKIDTTGELLWDKTIGGSGSDIAKTVTVIDERTYFIGGVSESDSSGDKTCPNYGGDDIWFLQFDVTTLGSNTVLANNFSLLPNPSTKFFTITGASLNELQKVVIADFTGEIVSTTDVAPNTTTGVTIQVEQLPKGTYFVHLVGKSFVSDYSIMKN